MPWPRPTVLAALTCLLAVPRIAVADAQPRHLLGIGVTMGSIDSETSGDSFAGLVADYHVRTPWRVSLHAEAGFGTQFHHDEQRTWFALGPEARTCGAPSMCVSAGVGLGFVEQSTSNGFGVPDRGVALRVGLGVDVGAATGPRGRMQITREVAGDDIGSVTGGSLAIAWSW